MKNTTKATAPSPGQPLQSSLSGGQGGANNLPVGSSDTSATTEIVSGQSTGLTPQPCGSGEPQSPILPKALKPNAYVQKVNKTQGSVSSTRPRDRLKPNKFDEMYRPGNYVRFYSIKSSNEANLTKLNMFKVDRAVTAHIGPFEKISEDFNNKTWTIEVKSETQGTKLREMKELLSESIIVTPHEYHNQSRGVITCSILRGYEDDDIAEGLKEQGVINCKRIVKNPKSDTPEPTTTLILTFNVPYPPDRIIIRTGLSERVRPYIPLPRRCFNCQNYGHSGAKCRRPTPVCARCGEDIDESHKTDTCSNPVNCVHCKQPHSVSSRTCPKYIIEKEILTIKTKEHLTFSEARTKVNANKQLRSYAQVTAAKNNLASNENPPNHTNNNSSSETNRNLEQKSSRKRTNRTDSSSAERPNREENSTKLRKIHRNDTPLEETTLNNDNSMDTSTQPDAEAEIPRSRARNSAPDIYSQTQQEILNNRRKISKERDKPQRDRSRQPRSANKDKDK